MGKNLSKTPLLAVVYAALFFYTLALMPFSASFREGTAQFSMQWEGYLLAAALGLWTALMAALLYANAGGRGAVLFISAALSMIGLQWIAPLFLQIILGEATGVMTQGDTWLVILAGSVSGILLLVMGALLFEGPQSVSDTKYQIKPVSLLVRIIVLPLIYCILSILVWYLLAWPQDALRLYYGGGETSGGFVAELIAMLLTNARLVPLTLCRGLLYTVFSIPLLMQLQAKRGMFIALNTMFYLSGTLAWIIPNPLVPAAVRFARLEESAITLLVFGVLSGLLLHTSLRKLETKAPPAAEPVQPKQQPEKAAGAAAPARPSAAGKKR